MVNNAIPTKPTVAGVTPRFARGFEALARVTLHLAGGK